MAHTSEYEIEDIFIDRLEGIGYKFIKLNNYDEVLANFREQLAKFNAKKLEEKGHTASFSDSEFNRIMIHVDNHSVYESAKVLRDKYDLQLDNGESVYIEFFSGDTDRNIYQVTHQVTMDKAHKDDVVYKNRYDVTVLINGLPLVQIELKRPGVEINEAINQINRYRKFSFKGIFRYLQLFVVSNSVQTKYFCNENEMLDGQYNPILKSLVFFWTDEKNTRINDLNTFTGEFFRKSAITEMLNKYMVIKTTEPVLMVMRPYQIYAVKAAKKRVLEVNQNGYVFACTGSGKTLTSFKLAQILRDEPMVDLVVFLIDRKDLDDQTIDEYNSFEKDCVDRTNSTAVLINMLKSSEKKMIVTTIQKMANAVKNPKYAAVMDAYKDKKVVFIIDECHRSQFGKMHSLIQKHFERANYIGFTGTPIFERNKGVDGRTTADVFYAGDKLDACLHKYMIKDAIADGNVLRFSVEYQSVVSAEEISINGIDPKQLDDPEYCRTYNFIEGKLSAAVVGIRDGKNIDMPTFWEIELNVPSLPEQQKIAEFLSTVDRVIEKQKETITTWKERKKGVMQKLFSQEVRFKANDGSEFPEWEEKKIDDIATCFAGATPSTKIPEYWDNGTIQWMSSGEVNNGQIYETEKRISQLGFDKCSTKMVKPNTVVMALAGQGKTRGMVAITRVPLCSNQSLCAIETNDDICDDYLYQYLQTQYNNLRLISSGDGTRGGLNLKLVGGYVVSMPCFIEQQKIVACLSALDDVIEKKKATLAAWEELKKGLLQQMFV